MAVKAVVFIFSLSLPTFHSSRGIHDKYQTDKLSALYWRIYTICYLLVSVKFKPIDSPSNMKPNAFMLSLTLRRTTFTNYDRWLKCLFMVHL